MSYNPSPRPTFDGPAHIPYEKVTRHLWGDQVSGEVADWIYVSSAEIHQLVFGLPSGGAFRHSDQFRTIFAADEVLHVLEGLMVIVNPETGEVHRVKSGEAVFFRRDTWHHCYSYDSQPLRVLEIFSPPPSQGTSGAYAQSKTNLTDLKYAQDHWLERWPMAQAEAEASFSIKVIRDTDILWRLEGEEHPVLTGILASTEHITVGRVELRPGQNSEPQDHDGEESLYLLNGTLNIRLPDNEGQRWFELKPGDGFFLPRGVVHQYYNVTNQPVHFIFGVAPSYCSISS